MAIWEITSAPTAFDGLRAVVPVEILSEFDGDVLIFTFRNDKKELFLAHLAAVGKGVSRYLVSKTSEHTISELKNGTIGIRDALLRQSLWLIDLGTKWSIARAWQNARIDDLPAGAMPEPGVLLTEELEAEQSQDGKLASFAKSTSDGQLSFDGGPVENHEIDAGFFGEFVRKANDLFKEMCNQVGVASPVLRLGQTSASSYAVEIRVAERGDVDLSQMFSDADKFGHDDERVKQAFDLMMSLVVEKIPPSEALTLVKKSFPLRQKYGDVLETLSKSGAVMGVRTRTNPRSRKLSQIDAGDRLKAVRDLGYPFRELLVRGRLIGGLVEKMARKNLSFVIRVASTDKTDDYSGDVSDQAVEQMRQMKFDDEVEAKLQIRDEGTEQAYTLIEIHIANDNRPHSVT